MTRLRHTSPLKRTAFHAAQGVMLAGLLAALVISSVRHTWWPPAVLTFLAGAVAATALITPADRRHP